LTGDLAKKDSLKIIQITDSHLFSSNKQLMMGSRNNENFFDVVYKIKNNHLHDADLIFLTGDLSQDKTIRSYQHIASALKDINIPIYWIPGNHDNKDNMSKVFSNYPLFQSKRYLDLKNWVFVFLNTQNTGLDSGFLDQDELAFLDDLINKNKHKKKNIAIVMHHHPIEFNTPLIDSYILENRNVFWSAIKKSNVKVVLCGHVHGDYGFDINNIRIESAPATCFQFKKGASNLELEKNIGYKIHYFGYNIVKSQSDIWMEPSHVS